MARIQKYLQAIYDGKRFNFEAFENLMLTTNVTSTYMRTVFRATKLSKLSYRVEILRSDLFEELVRRHSVAGFSGRVGAALDGKSHRFPVSSSMLILRSLDKPHPQVAIVGEGGWVCPKEQLSVAIIVENLENFLEFEQTIELLLACGLTVPVERLDVIFGSGNQVTNRLNMPFLNRYVAVYCLFDADQGGLTMFCTLQKSLDPSVELLFLYPSDIESRLKASKVILSEQERRSLVEFTGSSPATDTLIRLMRHYGTALEQETYLSPTEGV